jgi:WD40 repeat protein
MDLPSSSIDDHLFDIPTLASLPSLESILHEQDLTFDDASVASSTLNPHDEKPNHHFNNLHSSQPSSASFDSLLDIQTQPLDNYILKIHHQQQDANSTDESFLEIPKHKQINHGSLLKILELQTISSQLALCIERTNYGHPTTIDIVLHRLIAVGTTKSVVLLFEHKTQILKHCLNSDLSNGAVSALNFNSDGKRLLVGYACGRIQMYDCTNGKLLRNISNDIHAPATAILNIKFTHDPTIALFSDSGGSVYILQFTRHLKRGYQSKCLFSGSRGEVCTIEPLLFHHQHDLLTANTNEKLEQHPLKSMYIVALATFTKVFLLALKSPNDVKILHVHRLVGSKTTLPILKWQFIIVKISEEINCITPILVTVRDKQCTFFQIQYVRDDEIHISQLKQITVDYHIKSFCWLNARTFILFDMSERAHVIDQRSEEQLECVSLSHCQLIYNTIFFKSLATGGNVSSALAEAGQNACYQTLISNQGCVFLLGIHTLYEIHLRDWSERIDFYIENNKNQYEQALEFAYSMLVGKAKGLTGKILFVQFFFYYCKN